MNVTDAAHHTVHDYPGGAAALSARLIRIDAEGNRKPMSEAVLNSKVNPNTATHHLSLAEADQIIGLTGDHRILQALAAQHGYALQPINASSESDVVTLLLKSMALKGDFAEELQKALADNVITANEVKAIEAAGASVQAVILSIVARARCMATPATVRA